MFKELGYERTSMNLVAKRLGGSKATLYGYFDSKETLFFAVTESMGQLHMGAALDQLSQPNGRCLGEVLRQFGEVMTAFINRPEALAVYRMVVGEAGRSEIGQRFYEIGPQRVTNTLSQVLRSAIDSGDLRCCNTEIAARHLVSLIKAESEDYLFQRVPPELSKKQTSEMAVRAVAVFLREYGL